MALIALPEGIDAASFAAHRKDWPPERISTALAGNDLAEAAALAAALAAYQGTDGDWSAWLRLARSRDVAPGLCLEGLNAQELRYFGLWSMIISKETAIGTTSYHRYLQSDPEVGPFDRENAEYLMVLLELGNLERVQEEARTIKVALPHSPLAECVGLCALAKAGDVDARRRLEKIADDIDRPPEHQAICAYLSFQLDRSNRWARRLADLIGHRTMWKVFASRFAEVPRLLGIEVAAHPVSEPVPRGHESGAPRYAIEAGPGNAVEFGDGGWNTPPCHGCGHPIHVWFSLRTEGIPELKKWLPWVEAPLASCADCGFWMGVHRYRFVPDRRALLLDETELDSDTRLAMPFVAPRALEKQSATLRKVTAASWRKLSDRTEPSVVAGKPPRLENHTWPRCRGCRRWMQYYGALGQSDGFRGQPTLLNGGGFLLHFACVACSRVTVVPNWT